MGQKLTVAERMKRLSDEEVVSQVRTMNASPRARATALYQLLIAEMCARGLS